MDLSDAKKRLRGSIVPLVTPFTPDDEIDESTLRHLVDWQLASGTHGISVTGTTGEPSALSLAERETMIHLAVDAVHGRAPVLVGTGTNNYKETVHLTKLAEQDKADAALVIVPYYNKPSQKGLYEHLKGVADSVAIPIIIYNIPGRTAVNLEPETLARLASDCKNVIGVKEANTNLQQISQELLLCGRDFLVFSGIEALCFPMLALGGAGHVSATANLMPKEVADLYNLAEKGDWDGARDLHYRLLPLNEALFLETNPGPAKTALGWMGKIHPALRLPLVPPGESVQKRLRQAMDGQNLLPTGPAAGRGA